ncbi:hypothetical protein AS594_36465 [Streptomyces agglomeratus]|uniref:Uncharacterized protein n=1 Tax=Streptomyces agglomeratus TaxID=285458 RepID=A0A1E5PHS7_9ACTN|nr:DUF6461 domain-containing protein [Streptomyces agglomeratus]OEJ29089.1 hypothetical protein AS594_36465 [Streptomyces agglomeratus]
MTGLGWMYGKDLPLVSLTFARDLAAPQLLGRMGADPATLTVRDQDDFHDEFEDRLDDMDAYLVTAGRCGNWAWAWEHASWRCVEGTELISDVSQGTAAVVLHFDGNGRAEFWYAENGHLLTGFNSETSLRLEDRFGVEPLRFDPELRVYGAIPEANDYGPLGSRALFLRIAEGLGIGLPHGDLFTEPVLSAQLTSR